MDELEKEYIIDPEPIFIRGTGHITIFGLNNKFNAEYPSNALTGKIAPEEFKETLNCVNQIIQNSLFLNFDKHKVKQRYATSKHLNHNQFSQANPCYENEYFNDFYYQLKTHDSDLMLSRSDFMPQLKNPFYRCLKCNKRLRLTENPLLYLYDNSSDGLKTSQALKNLFFKDGNQQNLFQVIDPHMRSVWKLRLKLLKKSALSLKKARCQTAKDSQHIYLSSNTTLKNLYPKMYTSLNFPDEAESYYMSLPICPNCTATNTSWPATSPEKNVEGTVLEEDNNINFYPPSAHNLINEGSSITPTKFNKFPNTSNKMLLFSNNQNMSSNYKKDYNNPDVSHHGAHSPSRIYNDQTSNNPLEIALETHLLYKPNDQILSQNCENPANFNAINQAIQSFDSTPNFASCQITKESNNIQKPLPCNISSTNSQFSNNYFTPDMNFNFNHHNFQNENANEYATTRNKRFNYFIMLTLLFGGIFFCVCTCGLSLLPIIYINKKTKKRIYEALEHENNLLYNKLGYRWSLQRMKRPHTNLIEYVLKLERLPRHHIDRPD